MNDKKQRPFRLWYSQIQELRSLLSGNLKFAIFTATATRSTKQKILDSLEVSPDSLFLIQKDPNRDNIKYAVKYVENKSDIVDIFGPCINLLQHEGEISPRTIIFCQTRKQCALLYSVFSSKLKDKMYAKGKKLPKHRIVEMFHAGTPQSVKSHIIEQMALSGSHLRVLICTVAFGMGIDCKELYSVIHFGPPKNLECYLQESGRIGRDGSPSKSLILYNSFLCSACDSPMRLFLRTKTCRRVQISVSFPKSSENCSVSGCKCCDNCCLSCKCGSESCGSWLEFGHPTLEEQTELRQTRMVSKEQKERLKEGLKSYRLTLLENYSNIKPVSYPNIFVEFDNFQVRQVLEHCDKLFTISDIYNYVEIWRQVHANNILAIIEEIFQDTDVNVSTLMLTEDEACLDSVDLPQTWIDIRDDTDIPDLLLDSAVAENIDAELSCLDKSDNSYQNIDDVLEPFTSNRICLDLSANDGKL